MSRRTLEICVDGVAGLAAAVNGGADRIELCSALALGGLTPARSLMRAASSAPVPVHVMIRPRTGDFAFGPDEIALMRADIDDAREAGLAGVVLGASRSDGRLDETCLRLLREHAASAGLATTLHRAFDIAPDLDEALEAAIGLGFDRVLTSGGAPTALAGLDRLAGLEERAGGRIGLMPGSGIRPDTIRIIAARLGVTEMHASASERAVVPARLLEMGFENDSARRTSARIVADLKRAWRETAGRNPSPNKDHQE